MRDLSNLMVKDPDSCMPSAVNIYFGQKLFTTPEQFDYDQCFNLILAHQKSSDADHIYNPNMVKFVIFNNTVYQREYLKPLLNLKQYHNKYYLDKTLNEMEDGKYIIDYEVDRINFNIGHFTVISKSNGKIKCIEPRRIRKKIPFTKFNLNSKVQKRDKKINLTSKYHIRSIRIFKYKKIGNGFFF